jgi:hypothetical protein
MSLCACAARHRLQLAISKVIGVMIVWLFTSASRKRSSGDLSALNRTWGWNGIGAFSDHNAVRRRCLIWVIFDLATISARGPLSTYRDLIAALL